MRRGCGSRDLSAEQGSNQMSGRNKRNRKGERTTPYFYCALCSSLTLYSRSPSTGCTRIDCTLHHLTVKQFVGMMPPGPLELCRRLQYHLPHLHRRCPHRHPFHRRRTTRPSSNYMSLTRPCNKVLCGQCQEGCSPIYPAGCAVVPPTIAT